jgi:hypothetical protein
MMNIDMEKALLSYDRVMQAAKKKIQGESNQFINDNTAIGIIRLLRMSEDLKNETIYVKLADQLNVS